MLMGFEGGFVDEIGLALVAPMLVLKSDRLLMSCSESGFLTWCCILELRNTVANNA